MPDTFQLRNQANSAPREPGPRHDPLHMAEGLRFCWCSCAKCFAKTADGTKGMCICRQCPCQAAYEASRPMYVPHVPVQASE